MAYIAKHYVKIAGRVFTPGEIIDGADAENLRTADAERLLTMGAILPCAEEAPTVQNEEAETDEAEETEAAAEIEDELPELDAEEAFVVTEEKPASPKRKGKKK